MRRTAFSLEKHAQNAARRDTKRVIGWFAVNQKFRSARERLCLACAVAATFLANHKQQPDVVDALAAQLFDCSNLRRNGALGIARAASEQGIAFDTARKKWRNAIEV